ncbi:MAG: cupredoxin family protein [Proteobacteria bacterium]|nr:cupredoxin family protein [Pseudomonadota bacterium]
MPFLNTACAIALGLALAAASVRAHEGGNDAGFGQPGTAKSVQRTLTIVATDAMRFGPSAFTVRAGQTLRLHIVNDGKLAHEFVLGTDADIAAHAKMMRAMPDMAHADASAVRVAPGQAADIVWKFSMPGRFVYGCLLAGHFEAGMKGVVTVVREP